MRLQAERSLYSRGSVRQLDEGTRIEHLEIGDEIGRGAYGLVYRGRDTLIGREVALKLLHAPRDAAAADRERILGEARLVGSLKSPHVVTLYRVLPFEDGWIFEMEYVDGGPLERRLGEGRLETAEAVRIARGIFGGLADAHARGILHGDVKPSNVLLGGDGSVKLVDFGLARILGPHTLEQSLKGQLVGTPSYMAPEVIMGEHTGFPADVWSAGVAFYRMLAGRLPFRTGNLESLFFSIHNAPPTPLVDVPRELAALVHRCLAKAPGERPTPAEVLGSLDSAGAVVAERAAAERSGPVACRRLFGRRPEMRALDDALQGALRARGATVLVTGDAGIGKTALLREASALARERAFDVVALSLTPLDGVLGLLLGQMRGLVGPDQVAASRFGSAAGVIRPWLKGDTRAESLDPRQTVWACEELMRGLAAQRPLLLVVEDLHHADATDTSLLRELGRRLADSRFVLAVSLRTQHPDEAGSGEWTRSRAAEFSALENLVRLDLEPLESQAVLHLLEEEADGARIAPEIVERVVPAADGNPMFAVELLRHLEETGAVAHESGLLRPAERWREAKLPRRCQETFARRLEGLPADHRELLDIAAADGKEFDGEALAAVAGRPLLGVLRDLQRLFRERGIVAPRDDGYRFTHNLLREVLHDEIAPALRRELHEKLAEHLETRGQDVDPERLGMHWAEAGRPERARPYLLRAAKAAGARNEFNRVIRLAERAGIEGGRVDPAEAYRRRTAILRIAGAYANLGRHEEADRVLDGLVRGAEQAGDEEWLAQAKVVRARHAIFASGPGSIDEEELQRAADAADPRLRAQVLYVLGILAKYRGRLDEAEERFGRADEACREAGWRERHASVLDQRASIARHRGRFEEAERLYGEAAKLCYECGNRMNGAVSEVNRSLVAFDRGALDGLEDAYERSIRMLALEGAEDLRAQATVLLADLRYALGDVDGARAALKTALKHLERSGYLPGLAAGYQLGAELAMHAGDPKDAERAFAQARGAAEKAEDREALIEADALEVLRLCLAGLVDEAGALARATLDGVGALEKLGARAKVVLWLAESVLHGLPADVLDGADALLRGDVAKPARALLRAARAYAHPEGHIREFEAGADALRGSGIGPRRAALRVIADHLDAEACRRRGNDDAAKESTRLARETARRLGFKRFETYGDSP